MTNKNSLLRAWTSLSAMALIITTTAFSLSATTAHAYGVGVTGQVLPGNLGDANQYYQTNQQDNGATSISLDSGQITGAYFLELSGHVTGSANLATGTLTTFGQGNTTLLAYPWMSDVLTFHLPTGMTSTVVHFSLQVQGSYSDLNELSGSSASISLGSVTLLAQAGVVPDFMNQTLSGELAVTDGSIQQINAYLVDIAYNFGWIPVSFQTNPSARITLTLEPGVTYTSESGVFLSQSTAPTTYRITDLGTLGGTGSQAAGLNNSGQVTGSSGTTDDVTTHAFVWSGTAMQDLGALADGVSQAVAINDSGQVTGLSNSHAFVWNGTSMLDLGTLGGAESRPAAINDSGQVTGYARTASGYFHAFLWDGAAMQDLGTLGGTGSDGTAINASGQVTGWAHTAGGDRHAFLWTGTTLQDLGTLGGTSSGGTAINASGQVTGYAKTTANSAQHAFLWNDTTMQDLDIVGTRQSAGDAINSTGQVTGGSGDRVFLWDGTTTQDLGQLAGQPSRGKAINASGQVTGIAALFFDDSDPNARGFLWDGTTLKYLGDVVEPTDTLQPYVIFRSGVAINDRGQIAANGCDSRTGQCHAYLLSPIVHDDSTSPDIQPNVTGAQGTNDWYIGDVNVTWTVTDPESAVSFSSGCDAASVTTDTVGQTFTCTATSAGGTTTQDVTVKRDTTVPTASVSRLPMPNTDGWNSSAVTVHFTGTDATSAIASCTADESITAEGVNQSSAAGTCTDNAGNVSASTSVSDISIDRTAPAVTGVTTPLPGGSGWNTTAVTVSFSGFDSLSGVPINGCTLPIIVPGDGSNLSATGTCADLAGNVGSTTITGIKIDSTSPVAVATPAPAPNANGWNNTDVTVSFDGTDAVSGSGIATCTAPRQVSSEGTGIVSSGTCDDIAGNTSNTASATTSLDKASPTATISTPANGASYPLGATVNANFQCTDDRSGVAQCTGTVANGSTIDTATTGPKAFAVTATDLAGNTAAPTTASYTVIATSLPPLVTPVLSGVLGLNGWYVSNVALSWHVTSTTPVTASTGCQARTLTGNFVGKTYTCSATNAGGTATGSVTVKKDSTAPTAKATAKPARNAAGWRKSAVTVTFAGTDGVSGIASCSPPAALANEGVNQSASGTCANNAGLTSAQATASDIDIDLTLPTASVTVPAAGQTYALGSTVAANYACSDLLSGIASCTNPVANGAAINTATKGTKNFTVTGIDVAGNKTTTTVSYTVQ